MSSFARSTSQHHAKPAEVQCPNRSAELDLVAPARSSSLQHPRKRCLPVFSPVPSAPCTTTSVPIAVMSSQEAASQASHKQRVASADLDTVISAAAPRYRTSASSDQTLFHEPYTIDQGARSVMAPTPEAIPRIHPEAMSHGELVELTRALFSDGLHSRRAAMIHIGRQALMFKTEAHEQSGAGPRGHCVASQGRGPAESGSRDEGVFRR